MFPRPAHPNVRDTGLVDWFFASADDAGYKDYFLRADRENLKIEPSTARVQNV